VLPEFGQYFLAWNNNTQRYDSLRVFASLGGRLQNLIVLPDTLQAIRHLHLKVPKKLGE